MENLYEAGETEKPQALNIDDGPGGRALFELLDVELHDFLHVLSILYVFHESLLGLMNVQLRVGEALMNENN
jgi:hypothetical protein